MKRRDLLLATSGAVLAGAPLASMAATRPLEPIFNASGAALLPVRATRGATPSLMVQAVQIGAAFADPGARNAGSFSLDLGLREGRSQIRIHAWQLTRDRTGRATSASRVFMPFIDGRDINLLATIRAEDARGKESSEIYWETPLWSGGVYVLATRRRSTGLPPLPADISWDEANGLRVLDAAGHDFDAVLVTTV
jgi:hypothetical protein